MLKKAIFAFFSVILTACSTLAVRELPIQSSESQMLKIEQQQPLQQSSLLVVQFESEQWRWVQTDPIGRPLARLLLSQNGWQNDGFIAPNPQAQQLFGAIATALNPKQPPFAFSRIEPHTTHNDYYVGNKKVWTIHTMQNRFQIKLADHSLWLVSPIEQE